MSIYTTGSFWTATAERALKTFAEVAATALAGDQLGLFDIDWEQVGSFAGLAAVISVLISVGSAKIGDHPGPSLAGERIRTPAEDHH